jgi:prepilin-type N-terminal cleavage/methylation domain-containing protein/prepilin-type processing-associated H-X9-DG protein
MKQTGFRAFTLIELLVVIVIIAVLAALIIPAVQAVYKNRDETTTLSNMRQLGMALQLYLNENNYTLPGRVRDAQQNKWPATLATYLGDVHVYAAAGLPNYLSEKSNPLDNSRNNTSFIMNGFNDKGAYNDPSVQVRINQFPTLSDIILFGMQIDTNNFYMDFVEKNELGVLKLDAYNGGSIYLFADGSAKFMSKSDYVAIRPGTTLRNGDWLWLADKTYAPP